MSNIRTGSENIIIREQLRQIVKSNEFVKAIEVDHKQILQYSNVLKEFVHAVLSHRNEPKEKRNNIPSDYFKQYIP